MVTPTSVITLAFLPLIASAVYIQPFNNYSEDTSVGIPEHTNDYNSNNCNNCSNLSKNARSITSNNNIAISIAENDERIRRNVSKIPNNATVDANDEEKDEEIDEEINEETELTQEESDYVDLVINRNEKTWETLGILRATLPFVWWG